MEAGTSEILRKVACETKMKTFILSLYIITYSVCTDFYTFLEDKYWEDQRLTDVVVTYSKPDPLIWTLIDSCPENGELKVWLSCRDVIRSRMFRKDF